LSTIELELRTSATSWPRWPGSTLNATFSAAVVSASGRRTVIVAIGGSSGTGAAGGAAGGAAWAGTE
jgi:hypothetical protein